MSYLKKYFTFSNEHQGFQGLEGDWWVAYVFKKVVEQCGDVQRDLCVSTWQIGNTCLDFKSKHNPVNTYFEPQRQGKTPRKVIQMYKNFVM